MAETQPICVVDACERPVWNKSLGYCNPHYKRHWRHGDVQAHIPIPPKRKPVAPVADVNGQRQCQQCGSWKKLSEFHRDPRSPLGRKTQCGDCRRSRERQRQSENRERNAARCRAYRASHLQELRAKEALAYERNKQARVAAATEHVHLRRANLAEAENDRGVTITSLRKRDGDCCHYCKTKMVFASFKKGERPDNMATLEHIIPVSKGGAHSWRNCVIACWRCNITKGAKLTFEHTNTRSRTHREAP